jgi:predicted RNA-binding Zn ribbon-like protein
MQQSWDEVCSWTWRRGGYGRRLAQLYWEAARSAVELLTSPALARVRLCADDRGCGWLFLDNSPNRTRKWCDIRDCGNRAKARRYHLRKRKRS